MPMPMLSDSVSKISKISEISKTLILILMPMLMLPRRSFAHISSCELCSQHKNVSKCYISTSIFRSKTKVSR
ncbi:hypothetical protein BZA77DRAFT_319876 [Pyronema omphalodes]|nr:hypothetical protein BZA77DRAFT_319876 [Pyronema omphalodes]